VAEYVEKKHLAIGSSDHEPMRQGQAFTTRFSNSPPNGPGVLELSAANRSQLRDNSVSPFTGPRQSLCEAGRSRFVPSAVISVSIRSSATSRSRSAAPLCGRGFRLSVEQRHSRCGFYMGDPFAPKYRVSFWAPSCVTKDAPSMILYPDQSNENRFRENTGISFRRHSAPE